MVIVKLSLFVIWFWPLPQSASKRKLLCMKLYQFVSMLLTIAVIASTLYCLMKNLNDPDLVVKSAVGLFPCVHVIWNIFSHMLIYQRLQVTNVNVDTFLLSFFFSKTSMSVLIHLSFYWTLLSCSNGLQCVTFEMENFCALIEPREEAIVQRKYIDKYASFYGFCIASYYMTVFALFMGPIVLDQPLPVLADFPFDASRQPLRAITYVHQIVVGLQIAAQLSINAFMALLLWLASARFKLLTEDIRAVANTYDFVKCIQKHQHLLKYDIVPLIYSRQI